MCQRTEYIVAERNAKYSFDEESVLQKPVKLHHKQAEMNRAKLVTVLFSDE